MQSDYEQPSSEIQNSDLKQFKEMVRKWITIDDEIRQLKNAIKERTRQKKELDPNILKFMGEHSIDDLSTKNGKLKYQVTNYAKPITRDRLASALNNYFNDAERAVSVADYVMENRERAERISLRRSVPKKK
jgi:hypothetical protein